MTSFSHATCWLTRSILDSVPKALIVATLALSGCTLGAGAPHESLQSANEPLVAIAQINSGGPAVGAFAADQYYSTGGATYATGSPINTNGVANAAPAAVYQTERYGNFNYTIGGLTAGGSYTVRLHFAEIAFTSVGARLFNTAINGTRVLTNFDIFAVAGANTALVKDFDATANPQGQIVVEYASVKDNAKSSGIEVLAAGDTVAPPASSTPPASSAPPTSTAPSGQTSAPTSLQIDSGGPAVGSFIADQYYSTGGATYSTGSPINTSGVTNAAPAAVYQTERYGNFNYTIGGLTAGGSYTVRLHFAEIAFTSAGARIFNVAINSTRVLTNFDIFSVAGANTALVKEFAATANAQGQIVVQYASVKDNAKSSGIEVISAGGNAAPPTNQAPTVASSAAASPSSVNGTTTNLSVLGADDGGESNLTYAWATSGSPPGPVAFSANGSNAAKSTTATFSVSGNYTLNATITDAQGLTTQSSVNVSVTVPAATGVPGGAGWKMVWNDEFNGTTVDTSLWNFWLDGQTRRAAVNHAANTFEGGGVLTVRTTMTNGQLTAGGLESKRGFGSGYFEIRGRIQGWSAFWLQSFANGNGNSPAVDGTEMDIMETCCGPANHAVHWGGYGATHQSVVQTITVPQSADWNTYGLEWTPTSYKFWVNGQLSWTFTQAISQRTDEVIRLTQETTGDYCGSQCDFLVDYVRVYQPTP